MAFLTNEQSAFEGQPVQLYEFVRTSGGSDFFWRYTGADRDITYDGNLYKAVPISDEGATFSSEAASTDLKVTMPVAEDFCQSFRLQGTVPSDTIYLRIRRIHAQDIANIDTSPTALAASAVVVWVGTVSGISQTDELKAEVTCSMLSASFRRGGLRYGYQRSCPHVLYAPTTCRIDKSLFVVEGIVTAVTDTTVTASEWGALAAGYFAGGLIEYTLETGFIERRFVTSHADGTLTVMGVIAGMAVGDTVKAYPGCDRTTDDCINKFDNIVNFGGFPHLPGRNPFDGLPVF